MQHMSMVHHYAFNFMTQKKTEKDIRDDDISIKNRGTPRKFMHCNLCIEY